MNTKAFWEKVKQQYQRRATSCVYVCLASPEFKQLWEEREQRTEIKLLGNQFLASAAGADFLDHVYSDVRPESDVLFKRINDNEYYWDEDRIIHRMAFIDWNIQRLTK